MKMEHVVAAVRIRVGATVAPGDLLLEVDEGAEPAVGAAAAEAAAPAAEGPRRDLAEVVARHEGALDRARPEAVARRRRTGQRTARENVEELVDPGTFVEYGPLLIAAQRRRRSVEELVRSTPADGLVAGIGRVDGRPTAVLSYDYTVLAGPRAAGN